MKHRLVELLQSVPDGSPLRLGTVRRVETVPFSERLSQVKCSRYCALKNCPVGDSAVTPADCTSCFSQEILEGELVSDSGRRYPIIDGIPRVLSDETVRFMEKNKKSFSLEWKYFRFGERNWGQDIEYRKELFLKALGVNPDALRGKMILDAGCGSGLLAIQMADTFGLEVVAVDLASGIENAYRANKNPYVYFVQGSVLEPPFQDRIVDYLYCAGVLIHLPDTKRAFNLLPRCLKTQGRYFVWIYHLIEMHEKLSDRIRESVYRWVRLKITSRLPIEMQNALYLSMLVPFFVKRSLGRLFGRGGETRTWREKMQNYIDTFSPVHVNRHSHEEVKEWFRENHFQNVTVSYSERYGFGVRGDRAESGDEGASRDR